MGLFVFCSIFRGSYGWTACIIEVRISEMGGDGRFIVHFGMMAILGRLMSMYHVYPTSDQEHKNLPIPIQDTPTAPGLREPTVSSTPPTNIPA